MDKNEIIIYQTDDNNVDISVKLENDTIWLTQDAICALFESSKANISEHISNIYKEGELEENSTCAFIAQVQKECTRQVSRNIPYYNLDVILAVGYRVTSKTATKFSEWATKILHKYILEGYAINEDKLKLEQEKVKTLQNTISLLSRSLTNQVENMKDVKTQDLKLVS